MAKIQFENGSVVDFEGTPTAQDVEEVAKKLGIRKGVGGATGVIVGAGKGALGTIRGLSSLGERAITSIGRALTPKKYEESLGFSKKEKSSAETLIPEELTTARGTAEKAGKFIEQVGEFAIPASKIEKVVKGAKLGTKLLSRAAVSGSVATAQDGKIGKETAIAAGTELLLPGVGKVAKTVIKPVTSVIGRLFSGLGAGLSGVSSDALKSISKNPKTAQEISKRIISEGQETVLEENAKRILEGVSTIRKQARGAYGKGIENLKTSDISSDIISENAKKVLEKNGISVVGSGFDFSSSEIINKNIIKKADDLLKTINSPKGFDGKSIRNLIEKIDASKFKSTGGDPDRLAYNALAKDLASSIKKSLSLSTKKLDEINKQFSKEMSLADGIESIFGKVNFKNTTELNRVAKKLEGLFNQKGLDPKTVSNFLSRIGVSPEDFRTSEAVRGIVTKTTSANTKGLSVGELLQQVTSSVVTPSAVKNIAIATGFADNVIKEMVTKLSPTVRATIIKGLINNSNK